ncbi:GGDEF domain-containing protein [Halobacillus halophilus]|uniref:GGDEF domain-containing protein n=1 Tax=Halobacillus halophilus TaxID=1570 RepID=UPI001CD1A270|nr:diguanylate cyclase [Halobacillus halophilus]MCA1011470.1 diguanylate cyclase [Halobacillus halophilus]
MILKELISNLAILVALLFVYTQLTNSSPLRRTSSRRQKITAGILSGILSNVLMLYSMPMDTVIIDLRHIPVILMSYYGGSIPALIAMMLIIIGRFLFGFTTQAVLAIIFIGGTTFLTLLITRLKLSKMKKVFLALTISNLIFTIMLTFLSLRMDTLISLVLSYWSISYLAGFLSFYVVEYVRKNQKILNKYKSESMTDGLTGLYNVRKFDQIFNQVCKDAQHRDEKMTLLYIDIDHFKTVNDRYGHVEGDQVLVELSHILTSTVRSFDHVSRNGGEEFTVILLDCSAQRAEEISERIRKRVQNHAFQLATGETISITVSIGIACYDDTTNTPKLLIEEADHALYEAKQSGRNQVCLAQKFAREPV